MLSRHRREPAGGFDSFEIGSRSSTSRKGWCAFCRSRTSNPLDPGSLVSWTRFVTQDYDVTEAATADGAIFDHCRRQRAEVLVTDISQAMPGRIHGRRSGRAPQSCSAPTFLRSMRPADRSPAAISRFSSRSTRARSCAPSGDLTAQRERSERAYERQSSQASVTITAVDDTASHTPLRWSCSGKKLAVPPGPGM